MYKQHPALYLYSFLFLSNLIGSRDHRQLRDIDAVLPRADKVAELLLGQILVVRGRLIAVAVAGMGDGNNSNGVIYEIDTLVNGQPVQIACSSARDRYLLRTDGTVLNEGSGGAGHSAYVLNSVTGDGLVPAESVFTYFDGQPNDGYYHARDGYRYEPTDYDEYLTEEQFNYFVGAWEDGVYVPQLTMIA